MTKYDVEIRMQVFAFLSPNVDEITHDYNKNISFFNV